MIVECPGCKNRYDVKWASRRPPGKMPLRHGTQAVARRAALTVDRPLIRQHDNVSILAGLLGAIADAMLS